jgi:hypothetical protein
MKNIYTIILAIFMMVNLSACEASDDAELDQKQKTTEILNEVNREIGMPNITNFQEKKLVKMVMEQRDKADLICYAYIKSDFKGSLTFIGKCIGYGIPYTLSFTSPEKGEYYQRGGVATLPQAEPTGLYTNGVTTSATWLFMIDPKTGESKPVYVEPEIVISPFPLK